MAFHRFVDPSYDLQSGESFPGSVWGMTMDRINVVSGGVGGGDGSAYADGQKADGPNTGTYFMAYGESATSMHFNRLARALAENTDALDDILHRPIAEPTMVQYDVATTIGGCGLGYDIWFGDSITTPINDLFSVVDQDDNEIVDDTTNPPTKIVVDSFDTGAIGDGFVYGPVTCTFNRGVTTSMASKVRVYFGKRSTLATLDTNALCTIKLRAVEEVSSEVEQVIKLMKWDGTSGSTWTTTPLKNIYNLAYTGLDAVRRLQTTGLAPAKNCVFFPTASALDTEGAGGWFARMYSYGDAEFAPGLYGESYALNDDLTGTSAGKGEFALGALWSAFNYDYGSSTGITKRLAATSGFVYVGTGRPSVESFSAHNVPGLYGFGHYADRSITDEAAVVDDGSAYTWLKRGAACTLVNTTLTLPVTCRFQSAGETALQVGADILVLKDASGKYFNFVVASITSPTVVEVRFPDGSKPAVTTNLTFVQWLAPIFQTSDNAASLHADMFPDAGAGDFHNDGLLFTALPLNDSASTLLSRRPIVQFFGPNQSHSTLVGVWGGHNSLTGVLGTGGTLRADGGATFDGLLEAQARLNVSPIAWDGNPLVVAAATANDIFNMCILEASKTSSGSGLLGKYRLFTSYSSWQESFNADVDPAGTNWTADDSTKSAFRMGVRSSTGPYLHSKFTTGVGTWGDGAWDNLTAAVCLGYKFLVYAETDTIDPITGTGVDNFFEVARSNPSPVASMYVSFPKANGLHYIEAQAELTALADTADKYVEMKMQYRIDGGGWTDVPGSKRAFYNHHTSKDFTLTSFSVFQISGVDAVLTTVDLKAVVSAEAGVTVSFNVGGGSVLRAKLNNLSPA